MNRTLRLLRPALAALAALLAGGAVTGAAFIRNPSFQSNFNDTTDPLAPGQPQGWPYYGPVDEWAGASGVNDLDYDPNGPFHNAGTPVPDRNRVGFKQGGGNVTQDLSGLEPGGTYWLQFFYDGRRGGGAAEEVVVFFNDTEIGRDPNVRPSTGGYFFMNAPFTAAADSDFGTIRFTHIVSGDRTLLLDAVTVVARSTNDVVLKNPSFEASGTLPATGVLPNLAGWTQTGVVGVDDGTSGHADNGTAPDQDLVAFIEGEGSLSQTLDGLILGNEYEIRLSANARTGTAPRLQMRLGESVVLDQAVAPGGYQAFSVRFTATTSETLLVVAQTQPDDATLLVDNIRVLGTVKPPLPPMTFSPLVSEVSPGQTVAHTLTLPAAAVATEAVTIRLASSSPAVGRVEGSGDSGSLALTFAVGETTKSFNVEALTRGTFTVTVVEAARIPFTATPAIHVVGSLVKNASFESGPAAALPGYGPVIGWQGQGNFGLNRTDAPANPAGPFGDNGLVPDREQVAFIQGAGSLSQTLNGLHPGRGYWLQYHYNARACCNERAQKLTVRFDGQVVAEHDALVPAGDLGEVQYHRATIPVTPGNPSALLEFVHEVTGDASVVLDAVSLVPRKSDEIVLQNPSFEASGSPPGVGYLQPYQIAGWEGAPGGGRGINVDGEGPFSDNGDVPDQDRTAFLQGVGGFLSQAVTGLTAGQRYTLVVSLNGRNCCGGIPVARVAWNDATLLEEEVPPVGGRTPFAAKYIPFTAEGTDGVLRIELSGPAGSDVSLLVDDVHLVPGDRTPPVVTTQPESRFVEGGTTVTFTVGATGSDLTYQWRRNGQPLVEGARIGGTQTTTLAINGAGPTDDGEYTVLVSDGLGVVSSEVATLEVESGTTPPTLRAQVTGTGVRIRWPAEAAGYRLQRSGPLGGPWTDEPATVVIEGGESLINLPLGSEPTYFRLTD